ncbi:sensor histidine kinase [Pseudophaeobacter sp.]|uniref:sensor histidine kinase n=1 Tax=Pseudophaeobacter sp. TaxID=1971739 RepID=UPI00262344C6|nr:sensor histidine kinase [Pseudophaeobacter sp.]
MSLALLPIGLIAVSQTKNVSREARENAELALLALTEQAALQERLLIKRAFGAAVSLGTLLPDLLDDTANCNEVFGRFVAASDRVSFAGFVPVSGRMTCSSEGQPFNFSQTPGFAEAVGSPRPRVGVSPDAPLIGGSVATVSQPVFQGSALTGFVTVFIPNTALGAAAGTVSQPSLIDVVTFDRSGDMLTSVAGLEQAAARLPADFDINVLSREASGTFSQINDAGEDLIYTIVPIEGGQIFVLGIWDGEIGVAEQITTGLPPSIFPVLMWIISLIVALFAVHRLVIRHVGNIARQMTRFAQDRTLQSDRQAVEMPTELQSIQGSFLSMADIILRDEAEMEDSVRQQSVLIKEVHHRVKNNLQLISSILNMQIREAEHDDTKRILRRMQDRVLSLATIHRDLYQTSSGGLVNVGVLVREIVEKTLEIGIDSEVNIDLTTDIDDVMLFPDQAVPMSLLAAEAATNAMKYVGAETGQNPWLNLSFTCDDQQKCLFEFANSVGKATDVESTGMGAKLISAFAIQLGAEIDVDQSADAYKMTVNFKAAAFTPEPGDY